eukprot:TRINITY_DN23660_c0_g1_i1.p1 TRINITY_DN23660_c0_g1~~TRINITY_DN23660_c0_g1_i1.p1  ORF type:complete len:466 (+),score=93.46 TRINITY_DN23660_c0_g1_i1:78-1475(+)
METKAGPEKQEDNYVQELLGSAEGRERCKELLRFAGLAYDAGDDPAPNGGFPAFSFVCSDAVGPSGYCKAGTLRAIGRVRASRVGLEEEDLYDVVVELAFRGTINMENWLTNIDGKSVPCCLEGGGGLVHQGFQSAYLALRQELHAQIESGLRPFGSPTGRSVLVVATGHSLGGALAMCAAIDLVGSRGHAARVATWGSPRVGDAAFVEKYKMRVDRTARFVNKFDPVPRLPPSSSDEIKDDADAVFGLASKLLHMPMKALGATGYQHVCVATQLDDAFEASVTHWAGVAQTASSWLKRAPRSGKGQTEQPEAEAEGGNAKADDLFEQLVPHRMDVYTKNLEARTSSQGVGARSLASKGFWEGAISTAATVWNTMPQGDPAATGVAAGSAPGKEAASAKSDKASGGGYTAPQPQEAPPPPGTGVRGGLSWGGLLSAAATVVTEVQKAKGSPRGDGKQNPQASSKT